MEMRIPTSSRRPLHVKLVPHTSVSGLVTSIIELVLLLEALWFLTHEGEHLHTAFLTWITEHHERVQQRIAHARAVDATHAEIAKLPEAKRA